MVPRVRFRVWYFESEFVGNLLDPLSVNGLPNYLYTFRMVRADARAGNVRVIERSHSRLCNQLK